MKSLTSHFQLPPAEFRFAGFSFPRWVATLPTGSRAAEIDRRNHILCGPYYSAPKPNATSGRGFYLDSDGMPGLRYELTGERYGNDDPIEGIVFRLPRGRGFLAGWTMGRNMASGVDGTIHDNERDATQAANAEAEKVAESEGEHAERFNQAQELESRIESSIQRLRECVTLRHSACFDYVRDEISELIESIRNDRDTLATEFEGVL